MIKGINEKPTTDTILSGERLQVSLLKTGTRQGCLLETPPPIVMVLEARPLGGNQVYMRSRGWSPHGGFSFLLRRTRERASCNPEEGSHQNPPRIVLAPRSRIPDSKNYEK